MAELITRNGGAMSSQNFMRLVKQVIADKIIDGCAITYSGAVIYISAGHIVAGGALVEVDNMSVTASSGGELVLRINTADSAPAQIIARPTATLTKQDLTTDGIVYEMRLATYTYASNKISSLTVVTGGSSSSSDTSPSSPSSDSSPSSGGGKSFSGVVVSKVSSTVSSPTVNYSLSHSTVRSGKITMSLTFSAWLNSSGSKLGTGVRLTVYARIGGGSWQSVTLKPASASWSGTARHTAQLTLTASDADSAKVEFYVTRSGSTYAGTAGNLGSASSPKSYTVKLT